MTATPPTNPVVSGATSPRPNIQRLRASEIRALANAGTGRKDLLAFWYGEPDEVTPEFIRRAGVQALQNGDTFYAPNLGVPDLRAALARYVSRLRRSTTIDQVAVTSQLTSDNPIDVELIS